MKRIFSRCSTIVAMALAGFLPAGISHAEVNKILPYWAQPYPTNYVYNRAPPPPNDCYDWRTVDTFFGPRRERVWVCDGAVSARY